MGISIYPQEASCAKDEIGLVELKREENSLGGNRKFWWMRSSSKAQGDHSRSIGSCPTGLPVFGLCLNLDWAPEPHRVPAFMCSEQRQVLCASLLLSLGLPLDVPRMFLPWKPGLFLPLELSISSLEMQVSFGGQKNEKQPTLFKSANNSTKKVAPKRLMTKGGLVNRNGNHVICGQYRSRADGNIFLQYSPGVCLLPSESTPPSLSPAP